MIVRNFLKSSGIRQVAHGGHGEISNVFLYGREDFDTPLRFIIHAEVPPGHSIGEHRHGHDEEVYVILSGHGRMTVNGDEREVEPGDVLLNKPGWSHGLRNTSDEPLRILVFEVGAV